MALDRDIFRLIDEYGQQLTLRRQTQSYDPTTGDTTTTTNDYDIQGKFSNYRENLIDGSTVLVGDRQLHISPIDPVSPNGNIAVTPKQGDEIIGSRDKVQIVSVQYIEQSGSPIGYIAQVRSG
jgi:hypothetical protein